MCWSAEVSLQSFLIGAAAIGIASQYGLSLPTAIFSATIVGMQLVEFFAWTYYGNKTVNLIVSLAAAALLFIQPIASILTLGSKHVLSMIQLYIGSILATTFLLPKPTSLHERYRMTRGENGHLVWHWLDGHWSTNLTLIIYFLFLFTPLLRGEWSVLLLAMITLGLSLYSYFQHKTWGSMWCWIVNYIVVAVCGYTVLIHTTKN